MKSRGTNNLRLDLDDERNEVLDAMRELPLSPLAVTDMSLPAEESGINRTPVSLEFVSCSEEEWEAFGQELKRATHGVSWYIGDWLNYGKKAFPKRYEYLMPLAKLKKQQLYNIASVAGKFSPERRHASLSFRHHELVASRPQQQQDTLLALAEANKWGTTRLRREVMLTINTGKVKDADRGEPLITAYRGLLCEPVNEQGVVFLFGLMAKDLGFLVEVVQTGFPDCFAKRRTVQGKWKPVRIEFEFESYNFSCHGHWVDGCDLIVCWRDNWPNRPKSLEVVELKAELNEKLKAKLKALLDSDTAHGG